MCGDCVLGMALALYRMLLGLRDGALHFDMVCVGLRIGVLAGFVGWCAGGLPWNLS